MADEGSAAGWHRRVKKLAAIALAWRTCWQNWRGGRISLPEAKYGKQRRPFRTVRQAIAHFPKIAAGERDPEVPNHVAVRITELNLERLRVTPHDGGGWRNWPKDLRLNCHTGAYSGHTDVYGRMCWDYIPHLLSRGVATAYPTAGTDTRNRTGRYHCVRLPHYSLFPMDTGSLRSRISTSPCR